MEKQDETLHTYHSNKTLSGNLKTEIEEKQQLEKENFDLKMKVYYLENNIRQITDGVPVSEVDDLRSENSMLRIQLEDSYADLEQRNSLLVKAKGAIEALKGELDNVKAKLDSQLHTEQDTSALHRTISSKNDEIYHLKQDLNECRMSLDSAREDIEKLSVERDAMLDKQRLSGMRSSELDDEIVRVRTENDMLKIEAAEHSSEVENLRERLHRAEAAKARLEEEAEERLAALTDHYEAKVEEIKYSSEKEVERIHSQHSEALTQTRESFRNELETLRDSHSEEVRELRSQEHGDIYKVKEELMQRVHEKSEEVMSLKGGIELERSKVEGLVREVEALKVEIRTRDAMCDSLKQKCADVESRLLTTTKTLDDTVTALHAQREETTSLKYEAQRDKGAVDELREELRERGTQLSTLQSELNRYKEENNSLKSLSAGAESTYRENEKQRAQLSTYSAELENLKVKYENLTVTNQSQSSELSRRVDEVAALRREAVERQDKIDSMVDEMENLRIDISEEKARSAAVEAALTEQRSVSSALRAELDSFREERAIEEKRLSEEGKKLVSARSDFGKTCSVVLHALLKWDQVLVLAMESFDSHDSEHSRRLQLMGGSRNNSLSVLWTDGYTYSSNDMVSLVEGMLERPDDLLQSSIAIVERIQVKMERLVKIRKLFEVRSQTMVTAVQTQLQTVQDRASLLTHKVADLSSSLSKAQNHITNDRKAREESSREMRSFQQDILNRHAQQVREIEDRYTETNKALTLEKQRTQTLEHEVAVLKEEVAILTSQVDQMAEAEDAVAKLSSQFNDVAESNKLMSYELDDRGERINTLRGDIKRLEEENSSLSETISKLNDNISMRDNLLNEQESQIGDLKSEVKKLRQRQINPDLEKSIRESEGILRSSLLQHDTTSTSADVSTLKVVVDRASDLLVDIGSLVNDTRNMLHSYEAEKRTSPFDMGLNGGLKSVSVEQSISDLLHANSKLSLRLQSLVADSKRTASLRSLESTYEQHDKSNTSLARSQVEVSARETPQQPKFSLDMLDAASDVAPLTPPHSDSGIEGNGVRRSVSMHDTPHDREGLRSHRPDDRNKQRSHVHFTSPSPWKASTKTTHHRKQTPYHSRSIDHPDTDTHVGDERSWRPSSPDIDFNSYRGDTPSRDAEYMRGWRDSTPVAERRVESYNTSTSGATPYAHGRAYQMQQRAKFTPTYPTHHYSGYRHSNTTTKLSVSSSPPMRLDMPVSESSKPESMAPKSVARESALRLAKLGTDLQSLASKLDSFHGSQRSGT
eukprot:CAMPEP_0185020024 /NCGR_PEP_ID=MMETSP1103-20130426/2612_1 /TAXON_ID=36769 /ORGANISM="Paraphysomonas bandaiensis, Strain Caron Lab Isolate" /LENGTH=1277 /DNA_ID=CAMNT_0027550661 /DNA_START=67 /DNA_END=3897 /DNA_ORIENTATION=+